MYKDYEDLNAKERAQADGMFNGAGLLTQAHKDYAYEVTGNGTILSRRQKASAWEYRGYKIHWNYANTCWRFYERIQGGRLDPIDTMTPTEDIDHILSLSEPERVQRPAPEVITARAAELYDALESLLRAAVTALDCDTEMISEHARNNAMTALWAEIEKSKATIQGMRS